MNNEFRYKNLQLQVQPDNFTKACEGFIDFVNSHHEWFDDVDDVIQSAAGDKYHQAAKAHLYELGREPRQEEVVCIDGAPFQHSGGFRFVLFVIDDQEVPLCRLIHAALMEAHEQGISSIILPILSAAYPHIIERIAVDVLQGIKQFGSQQPDYNMSIAVVPYGDCAYAMLRELLSQAQAVLR